MNCVMKVGSKWKCGCDRCVIYRRTRVKNPLWLHELSPRVQALSLCWQGSVHYLVSDASVGDWEGRGRAIPTNLRVTGLHG